MGRDKAWVPVHGQPLLARMVAMARDLDVADIFISGRPATDYSELGCPILLDLEPGFGPLAGVERGLQVARSPLLLVLAVDLPQMTALFLRKLMAHCDKQVGIVPRLADQWEPLAAIYPKRCHAIASRFLQQKRHNARAFAEACFDEQTVREYVVSPADAGCFLNCNTPGDLQTGEVK